MIRWLDRLARKLGLKEPFACALCEDTGSVVYRMPDGELRPHDRNWPGCSSGPCECHACQLDPAGNPLRKPERFYTMSMDIRTIDHSKTRPYHDGDGEHLVPWPDRWSHVGDR